MATKRLRGGRWHFTVKRAAVLPAPVYLSFENEKEGDEYVRRLEALLDRGVVPDDLFSSSKRSAPTLRERARRYLSDQHVAESDRTTLRVALESLPATIELRELTFVWATSWVTKMKREENLAPSTLRHRVGALARCLDWLTAHGDLPMNPLRLLPKGQRRAQSSSTSVRTIFYRRRCGYGWFAQTCQRKFALCVDSIFDTNVLRRTRAR